MEKRKDTKSLVEHIFTVKNCETSKTEYALHMRLIFPPRRWMIVSLDAAIIRS